MARLRTYKEIVDAIMETIGVQSADNNSRNKIKRIVNMVYMDEIVAAKRWRWLEKSTQIVHKQYYGLDTASVTPDSTSVTLSTAPNVSLGSFKGYRFATDLFDEVYTVASHTAGSTALTLTSPYQGSINTAVKFKIWRDKIDLPTDARETVEMFHSKRSVPVKAQGWQEFRKWETSNPKAEGTPVYYNTGDFFDPTDEDPESIADRYRQIRIYPSITDTPLTINVDYVEQVYELSLDDDEPVIPLTDRIAIFYGALAMSFRSVHRDEEQANAYEIKFQQKLARMMGEFEDGFDKPNLGVRSSYMSAIRGSGLRRRRVGLPSITGSGGYSAPTFARDITLEGGTITANFAVNPDVTIDGRDISVDGDTLDSLVEPSTVTLVDDTSVAADAVTWLVSEATTVFMNYSILREGEIESGNITLNTDNSTGASLAQGAVSGIGDVGVTFSANLSDGRLRLRYTTTDTGEDAVLKYRAFTWVA